MRSPRQEPTISSTVLLSLYNDLSRHRDTFDAGLQLSGIGFDELQNFHGHISLRRFVRMFEWLAETLNDPWLGLRISQRAGPDALGAVGYLFLSSGKLETAVHSLSRYLDSIQSSSRIDIEYAGDLVRIQYRITDDSIAPRRQDSEYSIGLIWRYMKLLSKNQCKLNQISFEHEQPHGSATLPRRVFNAPALFGGESNTLTLPLQDFQQWHEGLDPHLFPILEDHITNTLERSEPPVTFAETVSDQINDQILARGARAKLVANMLKISTVTLHRRLRHEGFRFKELVDSRSKALAKRLIDHSNLPIATISRRLGYSDPATFSRAFKRWFDTTPREYRLETQHKRLKEFRSTL